MIYILGYYCKNCMSNKDVIIQVNNSLMDMASIYLENQSSALILEPHNPPLSQNPSHLIHMNTQTQTLW